MRIVVAGTRGFPLIQGGVETHCESLYPELVKLGCEVIVTRRTSYVNNSNNSPNYLNVRFKDFWAPKSKIAEAIVHTFFTIIYARFIKADILHVHGIGPALLVPFARALGIKVVFTTHGPDYDRKKWDGFAKKMLRLGEKFGTKYANEVIVISELIKQISEKQYQRYDTHLIHNGVYLPVKSNETNYIESLGLEKKKYIIAVARFVQEKGFDYLVEAFATLKETRYKLVLVGDADHKTRYSLHLKKIAKLNNVVTTGFIKGEQLNQIYSNARLFVLPSFHEGLSLSLLEALSYDLDVLVSDIPANTQVNLDESSYFKVGNIEDLARKLTEKLNSTDPKSTFDLTNYQWETIAKKIYNLYKSIS